MDIQLFQFDSIEEHGSIPLNSLKDSAPIDLIDWKLFSAKNDTFSTISQQNLENDSFSSNNNSFDKIGESWEGEPCLKNCLDFSECQNKRNNKNKKKDKNQDNQKNTKLPTTKSLKAKRFEKHQRNNRKIKSKYNNMGGFMIGTISEILNTRRRYRFSNNKYEIELDQSWVLIQNIQFQDKMGLEKNMERLKNKISCLPRKQGAKKHIFKLINTESEDSKEVKICKLLLRKQIIYSLSKLQWLQNHVKSRDFKPQNDDFEGTKKVQRHQAYFNYLNGIRENLERKNCIPKRIMLAK